MVTEAEVECELCGGAGEVMASTLRDDRDQVACPMCVSSEKNEIIAQLRADIAAAAARPAQAAAEVEAAAGTMSRLMYRHEGNFSTVDWEAVARDVLTAAAAARPAQADERAEKDEAYRQRNHLVAALARLYPSGIRPTNIDGWDAEWHGCVYIDLPSGQISYHYHDSQARLFNDLPPYTKPWDEHDKETVHERLSALAAAARPAQATVK